MVASSALCFAAAASRTDNGKKGAQKPLTAVFILQDNDEAGYFYHDLTQILGTDNVLFFPSSYRRAVKYGQRDAANEILRTETLSRLSAAHTDRKGRAIRASSMW